MLRSVPCLFALLGFPLILHAQASVDLQTLQPPAGRAVSFRIEDPSPAPHGSWVFGLHGSYAHGLLRRNGDPDGIWVATDQTQIEAATEVSLFGRLALGLVVPVVGLRRSDDIRLPTRIEPHWGLGDLRLSARLGLLGGDAPLGLVAMLGAPTGAAWTGEGATSFVGGLVFAPRFGALRLGARLAYRVRPAADTGPFVLDDELDASLGAALALSAGVAIIGEVAARVGILEGGLGAPASPWEVDLGVRLGLAPGLALDLGLGTGLPPGRDGYGAPQVRAFAMLRQGLEPVACGQACRADPDRDGVRGQADLCPYLAETVDGFEDADGCPDRDDDADGLSDERDACPTASEDRDGYEDSDGCPEPDNDADGILDGRDRCPMEPEDRDGFQDGDGCPEPGPEPVIVTVTDTRLLVSERIFFEFDEDTLREVSVPTLEKLAEAIQELPAGTRVRIEGHTDRAGSEAHNIDLSNRRAAAVARFLQSRGVPAQRLLFRGVGSGRPVAPNDTPEGRSLNRRVEFVILPGR